MASQPAPTLFDLPGIRLQGGFRFRRGQQAFLTRLAATFERGERNHLGVFVPGYGKTITALASFVIAYRMRVAKKLVVFVPRGNLRDQYADPTELSQVFRNLGAPPFSFCVADSDRVFLKNIDTQIVVTTYQYASGEGGHAALLKYCRTAPCLFVFDEVHHLADDGLWAQRIADLPFEASVALSGTPMRSDNKTLFGVPFDAGPDGEQYYRALHEVTMREAHAEGGILKEVEAHVVDYHLQMVREDTGEEVELSLTGLMEIARSKQEVDVYLARRKLRFHEVYLETLLAPAFERFAEKRRELERLYREAGGQGRPERQHQMLVIAMSNKHAAAMLDFVRRRFPHVRSDRIGQDRPAGENAELLDAYREGQLDVMVQVDMIGEGTDIKPISVIVKADLVRAYSKTMQQLFRGMRYYQGFPKAANVCDIYAAGDMGIRSLLEWLTSEQQLGIQAKKEAERTSPEKAPAEPSERSPWVLKQVQTSARERHRLELFGEGETSTFTLRTRPAGARNVAAEEQALRQTCADLASELAHALGGSYQSAVRRVHAASKRKFGKGQDELSLGELARKKVWLKRCLRAGRLA
ncbi:MAG: DEAD/DEAH box helicase family protein [Bacteroidota bacterium]